MLRLRIDTIHAGYERDVVSDSFGLAGATAALDSLSCGEEPAPAPRRRTSPSASFSMDTEAGIVATLVQSYIGDSVESVLRAMAGYEPSRSRSGEDRRFTYRFDDGSMLVLVFRPPGGPGSGLVLVDIAVR